MRGFARDEPPGELTVRGRRFRLTRAQADDVPALVVLLTDDPLGATREGADDTAYARAFADVDGDPRHLLLAVRDQADRVVATMQLTLVPGLSRGGTTRLLIEAVRVGADARGTGLGTALFAWAHEYGAQHGATLAQLTSDASRTAAHRFYERLGYAPSHVGFKRDLTRDAGRA